ncbi:FecCD family ABC transporter permease [Domibacillus tundrae]|uniref:FecCD family ABC transporter permease n=1 Tax=Domibacillus tundrae TaxID=1587527 RepID=UPI000617F372|nr:iron ABC transporter permease [Domibacillus tundrae]
MNGHLKRKAGLTLTVSFLLLCFLFVLSAALGKASLPPARLVETLLGNGTPREELILYSFRLPRMVITMLAGSALAVSGAILQSISRNPLADSGILGINAGAGLMVAVYAMIFTPQSSTFLYMVPLFAFIGGMATAGIISVISYHKTEGLDPMRLVLAGVGMAMAMSGSMLILASQFDSREYEFIAGWLAGSIWGNDWNFVMALIPWVGILIPLVLWKSNVLNLLNLNEGTSAGLGVKVGKERILLLFVAVALASAAVSVSGGIVFIGLMAPHIARSLTGPRHQHFVPAAAVIGALLLLAADTAGRLMPFTTSVPAGIIVTLIGAPYFMYLMVKK